MTAAPFPTAVSSAAQQIAQHVGTLQWVPTAHLHLWLPALITPHTWTIADIDGDATTRLLLHQMSTSDHWDGCEALNLYRVPGPVPEALVVDNADLILRDSHATDINTYRIDIPPQYPVIATRASGLLHTGKRLVHSQFHNYVINTAAGGALIEQTIMISADAHPTLASEAADLTENLYRALLASFDRTHDPRPTPTHTGTGAQTSSAPGHSMYTNKDTN